MPSRIHSFIHLTTQKTRHAQTLIRECFAFSTHPCVSQPRFYEPPAGEFISAGMCFEEERGELWLETLITSYYSLLTIYCLLICFDRNFKRESERKTKRIQRFNTSVRFLILVYESQFRDSAGHYENKGRN